MEEDVAERAAIETEYRRQNYWKYRGERKELNARTLVDAGIADSLKEAKQMYTDLRRHRGWFFGMVPSKLSAIFGSID